MAHARLRSMLGWWWLGFFAGCAGVPSQAPASGGLSPEPAGSLAAQLRQHCLTQQDEGALAACRKLCIRNPGDIALLERLAWLLTDKKRSGEAIDVLRQVLSLRPQDSDQALVLGRLLWKNAAREDALATFVRATQTSPGLAVAWIERGTAERRLDQPQASEQSLREALRLAPVSAPAWAQLSLTLAQRGQQEESIEAAAKVVELEPRNAEARNNLGLFLVQAGRANEALEQLNQAAALAPGNPTAWHNLGLTRVRRDELEEASRAFLQALQLKPDFPQAHHNLAVVLLGLGLCESAGEHLSEAHRLGVATDPEVLDKIQSQCPALAARLRPVEK